MAEDIGIELYDKIKQAFDARCEKDSTLNHIKRRIENGTATMEDTSIYARRLGELLRKSIESTTKPDDLPGEKMYYNIAHSILEPLLRDNYDDVNTICAEVQTTLDAKKGIGLKPQKADFPAERIRAATGGAAVKDTAEHAIQVLCRTAENITGSFQTDYVKKNAEFRSKAGLDCYIERTTDGKCCDWCAKLAGRYRYPDEVPKDVYRRHDNCTCDVSYVSEKGRQNVHTQQWNWDKKKNQEYLKQLDAEKKAKRAEYKANGKKLQKVRFKPSDSAARRERIERAESLPKPMKLTRAEAIAKESEILAQRRLTYDEKRGIIQKRNMANGGRRSRNYVLTSSDITFVNNEAKAIGIPNGILVFNSGNQTGFRDSDTQIYIKGDIFPDNNSNKNRDLLSVRATLAHEYYGHYKAHPSPYGIGDWRDEFNASYRAAIDAPNLSDEDRARLMIDAYERAEEAGQKLEYDKIARRLIYGY